MSTFQLIVKGSVEEALQACNERGVACAWGNEPEHWVKWNQTQLFAVGEGRDIQRWFNESTPADHQYHAGDLLWYHIL